MDAEVESVMASSQDQREEELQVITNSLSCKLSCVDSYGQIVINTLIKGLTISQCPLNETPSQKHFLIYNVWCECDIYYRIHFQLIIEAT